MYGTSDIGVRFGEVHWGGQRKDALDAYLEHSPLTYAANVETPVLLLLAEWVADGKTSIDLTAFSPDRFSPARVDAYLSTTHRQQDAVPRRH